jgi:hypothetical protein
MDGDTTVSGVSVWVGLDGFNTGNVVVQAGIDTILDAEGDATYRVWTEVCARAPWTII